MWIWIQNKSVQGKFFRLVLYKGKKHCVYLCVCINIYIILYVIYTYIPRDSIYLCMYIFWVFMYVCVYTHIRTYVESGKKLYNKKKLCNA